jgi:hypothetical protein
MNSLNCRWIVVGLCALLAWPVHAQSTADSDADIAAWIAFTEELKTAGTDFLRQHRQPAEIDRAEGPLYLAQQLAYVVNAVMARKDEAFPLLRVSATNISKWGLDGADAKYTGAALNSQGVYRLSGRLGDAKVIAIQAVRSQPTFAAFDSLGGGDLAADANGDFAVMISRERPRGWRGPWLPLHEQTTNLLVREYFNDWQSERPSTMMLERVDAVVKRAPLTLAATAATLDQVADEFDSRVRMWMPWLQKTRSGPPNQLHNLSPSGQGLKTNVYGEGWFKIAPDQALIIELDDPRAALWSFQLGNLWWESIDYINGTGSINGHQAVANEDGRYRLVIALEDPGVPNWLNPAGHPQGMIMYRFQHSKAAAVPTVRLASLARLREELPRDTAAVTPAQRSAEIGVRRAHAHRRWAP